MGILGVVWGASVQLHEKMTVYSNVMSYELVCTLVFDWAHDRQCGMWTLGAKLPPTLCEVDDAELMYGTPALSESIVIDKTCKCI